MKKEITEERIEEVVNKAFIKVNENMALEYVDNIKTYKDALSKHKEMEWTDMFFAAIQTAINSSFVTFKEALKELLCD